MEITRRNALAVAGSSLLTAGALSLPAEADEGAPSFGARAHAFVSPERTGSIGVGGFSGNLASAVGGLDGTSGCYPPPIHRGAGSSTGR